MNEAAAAKPAAVLDLFLTLAACALWYLRPDLGPWPLLLIAAGRLMRLLTFRQVTWRRTCFDGWLLLFLLSAAMAAGLAYDQPAAQGKLWVIIGGLALYDSLALAPERVRLGRAEIAAGRVLLALAPAIIALYFLLTTDWPRWTGKLAWLDPLMRWLASWQPDLPGHRLHPNVAAGLIAGLLPLQVAAIGRHKSGWLLIALGFFGLLLTASRGAWIALAAAAGLWATWRLGGRRRPWGLWPGLPAALLLSAGLIAGPALLIGPDLFPDSRLMLLRNSLDLALDYPFTGLGLAGFQMAYSSYVLLLHVGHTIHSHNLFLNLWIEQGLPGLIAFVGLLIAAGRATTAGPRRPPIERPEVAAALAALAMIVVHGMVDDAFYGSRGVLLLFVPFAVLARTLPHAPLLAGEGSLGTTQDSPSPARRGGRGARLLIVSCLLFVLALLPATRALFQANLGALLQTRAELSAYRWPTYPLQDALRRQAPAAPPPVDLTPAIVHYRAALALDPGNVTANRRLGQIELSLGDYPAAQVHLEAAYRAAPHQQATRQLLGESYAIAGRAAEAAGLWATVAGPQWRAGAGRQALELRAWWYATIGEPEKAARLRAAMSHQAGQPQSGTGCAFGISGEPL